PPLAPTEKGQPFFGNYTAKYPAFATGYGMEVAARPGAEVLATTTLPWPAPPPPQSPSIHSNPPWRPTDRPEVVRHHFGKGQAVYCSTVVETVPGLRETF